MPNITQETFLAFPCVGKRVETSNELKVELTKAQGNLSKGIVGLIFSFSNSNFLIVKDKKQCIFPLSNKPFHVCIGEKFRFFLVVPKGILKRFLEWV